MFLSRATSPCSSYLESSCVAWSYQRAVISPAPQTSAAALWATWALSAPSSQRRIHGRRAFSDPGLTSPWFSSSRPRRRFHPECFSLSPRAHIFTTQLPMSRRIKPNFEAARKLLCRRRSTRTQLEAGGVWLSDCLSFCLLEMLFSHLSRFSCRKKSNRYELHDYHDTEWVFQDVSGQGKGMVDSKLKIHPTWHLLLGLLLTLGIIYTSSSGLIWLCSQNFGLPQQGSLKLAMPSISPYNFQNYNFLLQKTFS